MENPRFPPIHFNQDAFNQQFVGNPVNHGVASATGSELHPLALYFGVPDAQKLSFTDNDFQDHYQLPFALKGQSVFLKEVIHGLTEKFRSWLNEAPDGLPISRAPAPVIYWNEWKFADGLMTTEPEEGVAELVESSFETNKATLIRKGKAMLWEHGFYFSEMGRIMWARQMQQISNHINHELMLDAGVAMISARPKDIQWITKHDPAFQLPHRQIIAKQRFEFMAWQKRESAPEMKIDSLKEMFAQRGVTPGFLAIAQSGEHYLHGIGPDKRNYENNGEDALRIRRTSPYDIKEFRGLRIRYTPSYTGYKTYQFAHDPFIRPRVVGEMYQAFAAPISKKMLESYQTAHRDIEVIDIELNDWARVSFKDAPNAAFIYDQDGWVMGTQPGDRKKFDTPPADKGVDNLFGVWRANGYGPANFLGEVHRKFLPMDVIEGMATQVIMSNRVHAIAQNSPFSGQMTEVLDKLLSLFTPRLNRYASTVNRFRNERGVGNGWKGQEDHLPSHAVADPQRVGGVDRYPMADRDFPTTGAQMRGTKRGRDGVTGVAYGSILVPRHVQTMGTSAASVPAVDLNAMHQENKQLLEKLTDISPERAQLYSAYVDATTVNRDGFVRRSNEILKSSNDREVATHLIEQLEALQNPKTTKAKVAEITQKITTPTVQTQATLQATQAPTTQTTWTVQAPTFHDLKNVDMDNFHALDPVTGRSIQSPDILKLDTAIGAMKFFTGLALPHNDIHARLAADVHSIRTRAKDAKVTDNFNIATVRGTGYALSNFNVGELDYRIAYLYRKYFMSTKWQDQGNDTVDDNLDANLYNSAAAALLAPEPRGEVNEPLSRDDYSGATANDRKNINMFLVGCLMCLCHLKKSFFDDLLEFDIIFPFGVLWFRPWISLETVSGICGKGGEELGYTFINDEDVMLGDDTVTKMHHAHITMRTKCVIINPLNITVLDDLWCKRYLAGATTKLFRANDLLQYSKKNWTPPQTSLRPSMYAVLIPISHTTLPHHIDIRGNFSGEPENAPKHFITAHNLVHELMKNHPEDYHPYDYRTAKSFNSVVSQATQRCYNPITGGMDAYILGIESPFGVNVAAGMRQILDHQSDVLREQGYEKEAKYQHY